MSNEINIWVLMVILIVHWFGDFVLQTDEQAKGKSNSWKFLLFHTVVYSTCFWIASIVYIAVTGNYNMGWLAPITFIFHTFTDYYTSRVNAQLYSEGKTHQFFVSVGFDQLLHFAQLIITYQILK